MVAIEVKKLAELTTEMQKSVSKLFTLKKDTLI